MMWKPPATPKTRLAAFVMIAVALVAAACGDATPTRTSGAPLLAEPTTTGAAAEPATTTSSATAVRATYAYEMTLRFDQGDGFEEVAISGIVDDDASLAELRFDHTGIAATFGLDPAETTDLVLVQTTDAQYWTGLFAEVVPFPVEEVLDPTAWYEVSIIEDGESDAFFLSQTITVESLWARAGVDPPPGTAAAGEIIRAAQIDLGATGALDGRSDIFELLGASRGTLELTTIESTSGELVGVEAALDDDGWRASLNLTITARGEPVALRRPDHTTPLAQPEPGPVVSAEERAAEAQRALIDNLIAEITAPGHEPSGRVVVRLSITGGWELPDASTLRLTIEDDGRVVRVADSSVFSSVDDYTSLRLSPAGIERVLREVIDLISVTSLDGGSGVSPVDQSARVEVDGTTIVSMDRIGATDGYLAEQLPGRAAFEAFIALLRDPGWLGDDILEPESPWIPETMTVLAGDVSSRSGLPASAPFAPWPLDATIEELARGTTRNPYGEEELVVCLSGDQVAPVFALLTGVNHAYLRVDDGTEWELNVLPHSPGYRLSSDPCP